MKQEQGNIPEARTEVVHEEIFEFPAAPIRAIRDGFAVGHFIDIGAEFASVFVPQKSA